MVALLDRADVRNVAYRYYNTTYAPQTFLFFKDLFLYDSESAQVSSIYATKGSTQIRHTPSTFVVLRYYMRSFHEIILLLNSMMVCVLFRLFQKLSLRGG